MKKEIVRYYKKHLDDNLLVKRITFRNMGGDSVRMLLSGGIDGKGRCSIHVSDMVYLHPEYDSTDNGLRLHSINQYFLRYNMTHRIKEGLDLLFNGDIKDIGVKLDKFDTTTGLFTEYAVVAFYGDLKGSPHIIRSFDGNPEDMNLDIVLRAIDHTFIEAVLEFENVG